MSEIGLDVGQANELKMGFRRANYTNEDVKKMCEGDFLAKILSVVRGRAEVVVKSILTFLCFVKVAAQTAVATSEEYFKEAGIRWMGDNFRTQFLGLEVPAVGEIDLAVHKLEEESLDGPIIAERGSEEKVEIPVSQFQAFLAANRGSLEWFLFYLRGRDGKIWAVNAHWSSVDRFWRVEAYSVKDPGRWNDGYRVVSRK